MSIRHTNAYENPFENIQVGIEGRIVLVLEKVPEIIPHQLVCHCPTPSPAEEYIHFRFERLPAFLSPTRLSFLHPSQHFLPNGRRRDIRGYDTCDMFISRSPSFLEGMKAVDAPFLAVAFP